MSSYSFRFTECILNFLKDKFETQNQIFNDEVFLTNLKSKMSTFCTHISIKWKAKGVRGIEKKFAAKNRNWLESAFQFPKTIKTNPKKRGGRPQK